MAARQNRSAPQRPLNVLQRLGLWPVRLIWLLQPLLVGPGILDAVSGRSEPVRLVVEVGLWAGWLAGMIAVLAPSTVSLTLVRTLAPAAPAAALLAATTAGEWNARTLTSIGAGLVTVGLIFLPVVGDPMINGSAYGSERRMALRPPAAVLLGPVQLAWLMVFAGTITGPLLLAAKQYLLGILLTALGAALIYQGARTLHQLARRWLVFVPAGFVIHDYYRLAESLLIQRRLAPELGLADAGHSGDDLDTERIDLSAGALGLALAVRVGEPLPLAMRTGRSVTTRSGREFIFTPSLPGQALAEARVRAIRIE